MSCDVFAVHMYGVDVCDLKLRPEIIEKISIDEEEPECETLDVLFEIFRDCKEGTIPEEIDNKLQADVEVHNKKVPLRCNAEPVFWL